MSQSTFPRRGFIKGLGAAAIAAPLASMLSSCAAGTGGGEGDIKQKSAAAKSKDNPFGMAENSKLDAVVFNGGYGIAYCEYAANVMKKKWPKTESVSVKASNHIGQELQPRFADGNPPDVLDNAGSGRINVSAILDQLDSIDDLLEAENYEGKKIADTLYAGVKDTGTYGDKFVELNYVMSAYCLWYSGSLFKEHGWEAPKTWDDLLKLGEEAKKAGKYLFLFGKEAADYYMLMCLGSAIKEGGDEVRLNFENLKPKAWSQEPMQAALTSLKKIIDNGYMKPGGAGTQFTAAQSQWCHDQAALLYPSGSWIENEMKSQTKSGFDMMGCPEPSVSNSPAMGHGALHAGPREAFLFPSKAKNPGAGKEFMRAMLSKEAATNFAKTVHVPTIVKGSVPEDGFGSTALMSLSKMLDVAEDKMFPIRFSTFYGMTKDNLVPWNDFLSGKKSVKELTDAMQAISDKVANDSSIKKTTFK